MQLCYGTRINMQLSFMLCWWYILINYGLSSANEKEEALVNRIILYFNEINIRIYYVHLFDPSY